MPASLHRPNVASINVVLDFIHIANLNSSPVMTLVDILVDVLDCLDRSTDFHIDVTVILGKEVRIVRDYITIGEDMGTQLTELLCEGAPIVWPGILWVSIITKVSFLTELLGVVLGAARSLVGILLHARSRDMIWSTTGTMQHVFGDRLIEEGMEVRIRELCRDNAIHMVGIVYLVWPLEEDEEMHMGQATLLELNCVDPPRKLSKKSTFDLLQQGLHLLVEDASNNVRMVCSSLACPIIKLQESFLDFRPIGICCHGQEDVRLAPIVTDCH